MANVTPPQQVFEIPITEATEGSPRLLPQPTPYDNDVTLLYKYAAYFGVPEGEEFVVSDNTVEIWVNIEGMFFSERNKWTFSDGRTRFTAPLHDDAFLSNIQKGNEVFKAGDRLLVKMKIVQKQKFGFDMRVTHEILNVIEHKHLMTQMNLPLENQ